MSERWRPVVGYEGLYEVSDLGRVLSLPRPGVPGGILAPTAAKSSPYLTVKLSHPGCGYITCRIHRLVGEAWLGPLLPGQQTRHGPGGKRDNRVVNLTYGTPGENNADQDRDGTRPRGSRKLQAKLTEDIVAGCRRRYAVGETASALAAEFGVSPATMSKALTGVTWQCVSVPVVRKTVSERHYHRCVVERRLAPIQTTGPD